MKYNLNLVVLQFHRQIWNKLWTEALIVHFTTRNVNPDNSKHCYPEIDEQGNIKQEKGREKGCPEWGPMAWFREEYAAMLINMGWEKELPLLG